ncbi:MAG: SDR family oxidoreductase [Candidatus Aminicenantes bacterium]|nr:SDR family oxidoreductase [Candidatus Aminicenantes bacterium]
MEGTNMAAENKKVVFLTGATGHVGRNLIPRILREDELSLLVVLVRAESDRDLVDRLETLLSSLSPAVDPETARHRIQAVRGDITLERFGMSEAQYHELASRVTHIIHSAANVRFRMPLAEARKINVEGTKNVMALARLARSAGRLERVAHISTAFISGNRSGIIKEDELDCGQGFSNTYEQSKYEAEIFLRQACRDLPLVIFRPSIIVGDSRSGATSAFNVLYIPLKYIARGLVRFIPCSSSVPLDVVPVDYICQAICHILFQAKDSQGQTYHLCAGRKKATTVGEVIGLALDYFRRIWPDKKNLRLRFISVHWMIALRMVEPCLGQAWKKVLLKMRAFFPYMKLIRFFDTAKAEAALRGTRITCPPFKSYFQILLQYCLYTNWGEQEPSVSPSRLAPLPQSQQT